jgi:hypothetical protein
MLTLRVEGHAIVSADGKIAAQDGGMPEGLQHEADWRVFQAALDRADLVVLGRKGHRRHPNRGRRRLVVTSGVEELLPDPDDPRATFWNPAGVPIENMLGVLGLESGSLAITGGKGVFDLFLPHYTSFQLSELHGFILPDGIDCFSLGHPRSTLSRAGLRPRAVRALDDAPLLTLTDWVRDGGG